MFPAPSLRCPVSISWLMSTRTRALSPWVCARIFIGSAILSSPYGLAAAPAEGDLDFARGDVVFAAGSYEGMHVRRLAELYPRDDRRIGALREIELRGE